MNVRNAIKQAVLAGLATLALPLTAQAALSFGNWSVTTDTTLSTPKVGVIAGCPTGAAKCTALVNGDGFLQQQVDYAADATAGTAAVSYIQTIVTEAGAGGTTGSDPAALKYSDESFVRTSGTQAGIAGKQSMSDPTFNFTGSTELYTGWAVTEKPAGSANLNITQGFSDAGNTAVLGDEFSSSFGLKINMDASGTQTGKSMSIGQIVEMGDGIKVNTTDIQRFVIEQRGGDLQTAVNPGTGFKLAPTSFAAAVGSNPPVALNGTVGNGATWASGDDVMLVWLGQEVSDGSTGSGLSKFGYESVTVVADAANATTDQYASTFSTVGAGIGTQTGLSEAAPFNWDTNTFTVAAPNLPAPAYITVTTATPPVTQYNDSGACQVAGGVNPDGTTCQ